VPIDSSRDDYCAILIRDKANSRDFNGFRRSRAMREASVNRFMSPIARPPAALSYAPPRPFDGALFINISHIRSSYESACRPAAGDICCADGGPSAA
jgi:hypothetical protein